VSALGRRTAKLSASIVVLGVLLAGCGDGTAEPQRTGAAADAGTRGTDPTDNATTGTSTGSAATATSVVVHQTGGIAGVDRTWTIADDAAPPPGMSRSDVDRALGIAASPAFRSMPVTKMKVLCCDYFTYSVSVVYSDGSNRTLKTSDGQRQAAPLASLLRLVG
jgi:hypothetical protein